MKKILSLLPLAAVLAAQGCHDSSGNGTNTSGTAGAGAAGSTGTAGGGAGTTGAAGGGAGTTGAAGGGGTVGLCGDSTDTGSGDTCNTAPLLGPCVSVQISTATAPTPAGGTIVAGTYNLTSWTVYTTADSGTNQQSSRRETLVVSGVVGATFTLDQAQVSGTATDRAHGTVVSTGTMVTFTPTCPPAGDGGDKGGSASYTATATTFSLIESKNGDTSVKVYTKS